MNLSYILNHLGEDRHQYFGAIAPPTIQTSNFSFSTVADLRAAFRNEQGTHLYTRGNNPTTEILCKKLAALAGADDALVFGSGAAAMAAAVIAQVQTGDHIVCVQKPYSWTEKLCRVILSRFGVETTFVDGTDTNHFEDSLQSNTRLFILESPNTFTFELQDLRRIAAIAQINRITTVIDNTYCTPLGQRCLDMGIDMEVHSASKYLNGHSDVVAGVVISNHTHIEKIFRSEFLNFGGILSPHDAWLILRGLRTLPLRLQQIRSTTEAVVAYLETHAAIEKINYPFHKNFPQYDLATQQMKWCGGLFSVVLKTTNVAAIEKFCEQLQYFQMAVSWGGHESLLMPACAFYPSQHEGARIHPSNLVRFYVGLEEPEILIADLKQALDLLV